MGGSVGVADFDQSLEFRRDLRCMTVGNDNELQEALLVAIEGTYGRIENWRETFATIRLPYDSSPLARDDQRWPLYSVSTAAWTSMASAYDHLDLIRLTIESRRLFPTAQFSVLRGALVAASQAAWLLAPSDSEERVRRGLQVAAEYYRHMRKWAVEADESALIMSRTTASIEEQIASMDESIEAIKRISPSLPQLSLTESVIPEAAVAAFDDSHRSQALHWWRTFGGDAHVLGWQWNTRDFTDTKSDGVMANRQVGGSLNDVGTPYLYTVALLKWALRRYEVLRLPV